MSAFDVLWFSPYAYANFKFFLLSRMGVWGHCPQKIIVASGFYEDTRGKASKITFKYRMKSILFNVFYFLREVTSYDLYTGHKL